MAKNTITSLGLCWSMLMLVSACVSNGLVETHTMEANSTPPTLIILPTLSVTSKPVETPPTAIPNPSTVTPTTVPSNTPTLSTVSTYIPKSNGTLPNSPVGDKVFVWSQKQYGFLEPDTYQENTGFVFADSPSADPSFQAKTLAFSQNSHQVAYVFYETQAVLWIADINLETVVQLWVDENDWLTYFSEGSPGYINWGPNDQFIILSRKSIGMVYQLQTDNATRLSGPCDRIAVSPATNLLAIWCPISDEQGNAFLVLEQDGSTLLEVELPVENVVASDWVFAPNGNRVLYASDTGELFIWNGDLNSKLDLNMLYGYRAVSETKLLKWSYDGTRIIVFGYLNGDFCPESLSGKKLACWSIRDANTGEILWWPNEENLASETIGALTDGFEIVLSPDNERIMMSYRAASVIHTIVVFVKTGDFKEISSVLWATAHWSK